jgi:hypothetical protein
MAAMKALKANVSASGMELITPCRRWRPHHQVEQFMETYAFLKTSRQDLISKQHLLIQPQQLSGTKTPGFYCAVSNPLLEVVDIAVVYQNRQKT